MKRMRGASLLLLLFAGVLSLPAETRPTGQAAGLRPGEPLVEVSARVEGGETRPGETALVSLLYRFPEGTHQVSASDFFTVSIESADGFRIEDIRYPAPVLVHESEAYRGDTVVTVEVAVPLDIAEGRYAVSLRAGYQLCEDSGVCYFPGSEIVSVELAVSGSGHPSILLILLLSLAGGLILNVMPCVLPVLSIKAMSLVKSGKQDGRRILVSSLYYTLGILVSFTVLAIVVIALKAVGTMVGWGFQFQNSGFVLALFTIIVLFALSLFDLFTIQGPFATKAAEAGSRGGYAGSFLTGMFAVLLATPCTAPVLGSALGFAFASPAPVILISFLAIGIGLSLPFLILGLWPGALRLIPKPGDWMNRFRTAMGFPLLLTAAWLFDILVRQWGAAMTLPLLAYAIALGALSWLYGLFGGPVRTAPVRTAALLLYIACLAAGAVLVHERGERAEGARVSAGMSEATGMEDAVGLTDATGSAVSPAASLSERLSASAGQSGAGETRGASGAAKSSFAWETFSPELVERYRAERRPGFVIFSASWCLTCKTNETTVLRTEAVSDLFRENGVAVLYGDYTNADPVIGSWIREAGRAGVPVYLWFPPDASEATLLPEILTKTLMVRTIAGR
jgi:thiol:disulfide interchange protein DsbD